MRIVTERLVTEKWVVSLSLSLGLGLVACSETNLQPSGQPGIDTRMHQLLSGPSLSITIEQAPQVIVTTTTPLNCSPSPAKASIKTSAMTADKSSAVTPLLTSCVLDADTPLPNKIVFRYTATPLIHKQATGEKNAGENVILAKAQPTTSGFINWQTYTLYPQRIMQKYKDSTLLETLQQSHVELTVTFDEDLQVTTTDELRF